MDGVDEISQASGEDMLRPLGELELEGNLVDIVTQRHSHVSDAVMFVEQGKIRGMLDVDVSFNDSPAGATCLDLLRR